MSNFTQAIKQSGKIQSGIGFGVAILGALAMFTPVYTGMAFSSMLAIFVGAASLATLLYSFTATGTKHKVLQFLLGLVGMIAAMYIFQAPVSNMFALTVIVIAYLIVDGLLTLYGAYQNRGERGNGWVIFSAITSLVLSGLLIADWPVSGLYAIGMFVGAKLMVSGMTMAMLGFAEHKVGKELDKVEKEVESLEPSKSH